MYLNTLDVKLLPRTETDTYNLKLNDSALEILGLVLEFKVATGWHISRFLTQRDQSKYIYAKLKRMWKAGLLESFKVYSGSVYGTPVFYMLSKSGLKVLEEQGKYAPEILRTYPHAKQLLSWGLFKHEAQVVELASNEVKNKSQSLDISLKGEVVSLSRELMSNKNIEVLTPDYTVCYSLSGNSHCIYSEFERTVKSKEAMLKKIERYIVYLDAEQRKKITVRLMFQTPNLEQSFWNNVLNNAPILLQKLRIVTTNLSLLQDHSYFLEPVYLSSGNPNRIKLLPYL